MKGLFIVFEGIDGCGKSTQIKLLAEWLRNSGIMPVNSTLHITREPGGTYLGQEIRRFLLATEAETCPEPITELLLYAADRSQHVTTLIGPTLDKGDWVISDRFSGSTLAYQGFGRNLNIELISQLELIATNGLIPDITFLLNLPIDKSIERRAQTVDDRIEAEGRDFLLRVSKGFNTIAKERDWKTIEADQGKLDISNQIKNRITHYLKERKYE